MNIRLQDDRDILKLLSELEEIEHDNEEVKKPQYRNIFYGVEDIQEYLRQVERYLEYKKKNDK